MHSEPLILMLAVITVPVLACTRAAEDPKPEADAAAPRYGSERGEVPTKVATFAGGCFWCMEHAFEQLNGVVEVISGFTGGTETDPGYNEVSSGATW